MNRRRTLYTALLTLILVALLIPFPLISAVAGQAQAQPLPLAQAQAQAPTPAMDLFKDTALGRSAPDAAIDVRTFLEAAVPYLTFEHGEDPCWVALKQGFAQRGLDKPAGIGDVLYAIRRMTGVDLPAHSDSGAEGPGAAAAVTAADACRLLADARDAWYAQLEAAAPTGQVSIIDYFVSNSAYSDHNFTFSDDGQVLWYLASGELAALNVADMTPSGRMPPDEPPLEEYEATVAGETVVKPTYDNAGVLRAVSIEVAPRRNYVTDKYLIYRESSAAPWRRIVDFDLSLTRDYEVLGFTADNRRMIVRTNFYDNYVTLYEVDPADMSRHLLYSNERADVATGLSCWLAGVPTNCVMHPATGEPLAVTYIDDKARVACLDDQFAAVMDRVWRDLGENQYPVAVSPGFDYVVLLHRDDRDYGSYRLYNVANGAATLLIESTIPTEAVGHTYPVSFRARDGGTVYAYLTLPAARSPRDLPLMVNVHGGPQARYTWTPDQYALLAANLGAAVLSVDFRFSLGYGNEYTDQGSRDKALAARDVYDAVQWAIANGIADPACIGVMGHSYGGFMSFYQAAVHPETYKAAIALMGVWDWTDLGVELVAGEPVPDYHTCSAPEPGSDLAAELSPSTYVANLKAPIFIVYSGADDAVFPSQNIRAVRELTAAGNQPRVVYLPDIGHVLNTEASINRVFDEMRQFLIDEFMPSVAH